MHFDFANALFFVILGVLFIAGALIAGRFFRPQHYEKAKAQVYECGEKPVGPAWINFNIRFYMIALLFLIFDVEVAFMFPVMAVVKGWIARGDGAIALAETVLFIAILLAGLVYVWVMGDLEWVKGASENRPSASLPANSRPSNGCIEC